MDGTSIGGNIEMKAGKSVAKAIMLGKFAYR